MHVLHAGDVGLTKEEFVVEGSPVTKLLKVRMDTWSACVVTSGAAAEITEETAAVMSVEGFEAEEEVVETDALGARTLGGISKDLR
jgi:hypothetical protein